MLPLNHSCEFICELGTSILRKVIGLETWGACNFIQFEASMVGHYSKLGDVYHVRWKLLKIATLLWWQCLVLCMDWFKAPEMNDFIAKYYINGNSCPSGICCGFGTYNLGHCDSNYCRNGAQSNLSQAHMPRLSWTSVTTSYRSWSLQMQYKCTIFIHNFYL